MSSWPTSEWLSLVCFSLVERRKVHQRLLMEKRKKKIVHCGILVSVKTSDSSFVSLEATHYFAHLSQSCTALLSG